jgi:hypothetical protein
MLCQPEYQQVCNRMIRCRPIDPPDLGLATRQYETCGLDASCRPSVRRPERRRSLSRSRRRYDPSNGHPIILLQDRSTARFAEVVAKSLTHVFCPEDATPL